MNLQTQFTDYYCIQVIISNIAQLSEYRYAQTPIHIPFVVLRNWGLSREDWSMEQVTLASPNWYFFLKMILQTCLMYHHKINWCQLLWAWVRPVWIAYEEETISTEKQYQSASYFIRQMIGTISLLPCCLLAPTLMFNIDLGFISALAFDNAGSKAILWD